MSQYFLGLQLGSTFSFSSYYLLKVQLGNAAIQSLYILHGTVHLAPWSLITTLTLISRGPSKKDFSC
jgi:hypothetical protein